MTIRLEVLRKQEERINKIKDMLDMYNINPNPNYQQYHPTGASSLENNFPNDPRIQATKGLFQMFHLA